MGGRNDQNGPKQRVWAISKFFSLFSSYICILIDIYIATTTTQKHHELNKFINYL